MPCNGGHSYSPPDHTSCEEYEKALVDENDQLTRLLCYLCGRLTGDGLFKKMPKQLVAWWKKHQRLDYKRVAKQMDAWIRKHGDTTSTVLAGDFIKKAADAHPLSHFHAEWLFRMAKAAIARRHKIKLASETKKQKLARALAKLSPADLKLLGLKADKKKGTR
jgi:hypothetical protein